MRAVVVFGLLALAGCGGRIESRRSVEFSREVSDTLTASTEPVDVVVSCPQGVDCLEGACVAGDGVTVTDSRMTDRGWLCSGYSSKDGATLEAFAVCERSAP